MTRVPFDPCRGKCSVTLLNETDILSQYLDKEVSWEGGRAGAGGGCLMFRA